MKIKIISIVIFFCMVVSLFCFKFRKNNSNKIIRLNEVTRSVFYAPQYVALSLGYFSENGLDIKLSSAEGSDKTMTSILSHKADIGLLGISSAISVKSQGKENCPLVFSQITKKDGSFLVGRNNENFKWDNLKGKEIIAGRKGANPEMVFEHILKKMNIFEDIKLLNNIKFDLMGVSFSKNIGDYVCLFEPTASLLEQEKSFYILEFVGSQCEELSYTGYCASADYINNNIENIRLFTNSIKKAQTWIKNHNAKEIGEVISPYFINCSREVLEKCILNYLKNDVWCDEPYLKENQFEALENIMIQAGELKNKVNFKDIVFKVDNLRGD